MVRNQTLMINRRCMGKTAVIAFVLVVLIAILFPTDSFAQDVGEEKFVIGQKTLILKDTTRNRPLTTELWYPARGAGKPIDVRSDIAETFRDAEMAEGSFPLILFSHGTGGGRLTLEWFCAGLASSGFIVAAVDHYGNTYSNPIPEEFVKVWERPKDITFVLDELLQSKDFEKGIDTTKIGAAGFSLGGFTISVLAGANPDLASLISYFQTEKGKAEAAIPEMPEVRTFLEDPEILSQYNNDVALNDKRIKSAVVMAPALGQAFPKAESFKNIKIPFLIFASGNDVIAPPETNAAHYSKEIANAILQVISKEAGHYVFLNDVNREIELENPVYFVDPENVDRKKIHHEVIQEAVEYFKETLDYRINPREK